MEVNGTLVWLNAPLTAYPTGSTRFFLSPADAADLNTLHQQITSRLPQNKSQRFFTVMLDPGHGGEDSGARSSITGQHEKDLTLDIAKRIGTALARDPIQVVIIRNDDFTMSLDQRTSIAAKNKIDCFVSIHANSAANLNAEGFETYILPAAGYPATNGGEIREPGIGNKWNPANLTLAYTIHNRLVKLGYADRGLKRARFYALQHSTCPAILVEVGFLSNNREARLLNTPAHRQKIADTIAAGIRDYAR
jgi:N-acetylmuramoyl-L-alanine amidase